MARPQLCLLSALVMLVATNADVSDADRSSVESPLESPKTVANINVSDADRSVAVYPEATHPLEQDLRQITGESDWVRMHSMCLFCRLTSPKQTGCKSGWHSTATTMPAAKNFGHTTSSGAVSRTEGCEACLYSRGLCNGGLSWKRPSQNWSKRYRN